CLAFELRSIFGGAVALLVHVIAGNDRHRSVAGFFAAAIEDELEWRTFGDRIEQPGIQCGCGEVELARHQCRHGEGTISEIFQFGVEIDFLEEFSGLCNEYRPGRNQGYEPDSY